MKKSIFTIAFTFLTLFSLAQLPKLAIISFDANDASLNKNELIEILRVQVSKHGTYESVDKYEINEKLSTLSIEPITCLSQGCLIKAGEALNADYVLSGSVNKLGNTLYFNLRMLDLKTKVQKETVKEFLFIPKEVDAMMAITVNEMFGVDNDMDIVKSLSDKESFDNSVNNPDAATLNLSGPRMGYTFFTGNGADVIRKPTSEGGYNKTPAFFQMGYQFEKQYLNEGNVQALFEFVPMVSGLDQGLFIPSFTVFNGIRSNKTGLEFAIGPSVNFSKELRMWQVEGDDTWFNQYNSSESPADFETEWRADSRGISRMKSYIVIAAGYSFKSGKLNIPVNAYVVPAKDNLRFGVSFGFNAKR